MNSRLLHAESIVFKDGSIIHDRDCFLLDRFLIVDSADPGDNPTYYNTDLISVLKNVTAERRTKQGATPTIHFM